VRPLRRGVQRSLVEPTLVLRANDCPDFSLYRCRAQWVSVWGDLSRRGFGDDGCRNGLVAAQAALGPLLSELAKSDSDAILIVAPPAVERSLTVIVEGGELCARIGANEPLAGAIEGASRAMGLPIKPHAIDDHTFFDVGLGRNPAEANVQLVELFRRIFPGQDVESLTFSFSGEHFAKAAVTLLVPFAQEAPRPPFIG
jgi:hypothetical protein